MGSESTSVTSTLIGIAHECLEVPFPDRVLTVAKQCILDWFGCALAGSREPLSHILRAEAATESAAPRASFIGFDMRGSPRWAALINGAAGHALDYDDVNEAMSGHPTAAILPAILALAESEGSSGRAVLQAFVAGYELAARIGLLIGPGHYAQGFHATGTVGAMGAAFGCATLMGLDPNACARALGIAASQAAGLKSQFGTMCKPFHAGKASENGLLAALLARRGFESRTDILDCDQGFSRTLSPDFHPDIARQRPAQGFHILDNLFKYNAACYGTHGAIEASREIASAYRPDPTQIKHIEVRVEQAADRMCNIARPKSGLEGKFSLRFNTALAISGGDTASLESYTDASVTKSSLVALQERIDVIIMPADWPSFESEIKVEMLNGETYKASYNASRPATDLVLQENRLRQKYLGLAIPVLGSDRAENLARKIDELNGGNSINDMMRLATI
ncbi:MAG: MmgE/PrpD family protein [Bacteroidales bacterium]|nr:MmgE/PrpD family protein [Bacteroidales bacterium]